MQTWRIVVEKWKSIIHYLQFLDPSQQSAKLKYRYYTTILVKLREIDNIVMQYWIPKQGKVGHPKMPLFVSDLSVWIHDVSNIALGIPGAVSKILTSSFIQELLNFHLWRIKSTSFNAWVRYFQWNFKGTLWNSSQNILTIHWEIWFFTQHWNFKGF